MRNIFMGWIATCVVVATLGCKAPNVDWNGTWKMNPSRGDFKGPVLRISILGGGEYRYDDGNSTSTFRCDGNDRSIRKNRTQACMRTSATMLDLIRKENGVKTNASHWELSTGAKVLTVTATAFRPSAPVITGQLIASRMSGSNDFAGEWQDTSYLQRHAEMTLRLDRQTLHIGYPNAGLYIDAPFDGVDAAAHGVHAPEGLTYTAKLVGEREIHTLAKRNGQTLTQGSLELSADGRIITDTWWNPDRPYDKGMLVYEKQ